VVAHTHPKQSDTRFRAGFLGGSQGPVFHVIHEHTAAPLRGCVLYIPPFAEELNKSRRMAALQARRLAGAGYRVMLPDLYGCGDSGGDFSEASWQLWLKDLSLCLDHLRESAPDAPVIIWGLRAGCLLLDDLLRANEGIAPAASLLWQPVPNGELFLTQFLRLRMAAGMMGGAKETTAQLRARLAAGEVLEVAGYGLAPALAEGLAAARLAAPRGGPVYWFEVAQGEEPAMAPASARMIEAWREQGVKVSSVVVQGEPFWATQEIREVPGLLDETLRCLEEVC